MYTPFRTSLNLLLREFERASSAYPPLFYEQLIPWECDSLPKPTWEAFISANKGNASCWQQFDLFPTLRFCGRFFGHEAGLEEAKRLGESLYLTLCEFDQSLNDSEGYHGFLRILDDMAFSYPTPLLRISHSIWGQEYESPSDSIEDKLRDYANWQEEQLDRWNHPEGSYPSNPLVRTLANNVFTSAMGAIHNILEPDNALLVGHLVDDLPFAHLCKAKTSSLAPVAGNAPETDDTYIYRFQLKGEMWSVKFKEEEGNYENRVGLQHIAKLLAHPEKAIDAIELRGLADSPVAHENMTAQLALERADVGTINKAVARLEEQRDHAKEEDDQEEVLKLENQISELREYLRQGQHRRLGPASPREKARKAVSNAVESAKRIIKMEMPLFFEFLDRCILANGTAWTYSPLRPAPKWVLD